jgi:hypothetical protein
VVAATQRFARRFPVAKGIHGRVYDWLVRRADERWFRGGTARPRTDHIANVTSDYSSS